MKQTSQRLASEVWRRLVDRPFAISMSIPLVIIGVMILLNSTFLPLSLSVLNIYSMVFAVLAVVGGSMVILGHILIDAFPYSARTLEIGGHLVSGLLLASYAIALANTISTGGFFAFIVVSCLGNAHLLTALQIWKRKQELIEQ